VHGGRRTVGRVPGRLSARDDGAGNRFRFLGGDPNVVSQNLAKLFEKQLNRRMNVQVEK